MVFPEPSISPCRGCISLSLQYLNIWTGLGGLHTYIFLVMLGEKRGSTKTFSVFPCLTSLGLIVPATPKALLLVPWDVMREAKSFCWLKFSSGSSAVCHQQAHQACSVLHHTEEDLSGTGPQSYTAIYWSPTRFCSTGHHAGPTHWVSFQSIRLFLALADVTPFFSKFKYTLLAVAFLPWIFLLVFLRWPLSPLLWWLENALQGLLLQ